MTQSENSWKTIWNEPRETIRRITTENPKKNIWKLAWAYGFLSLISLIQGSVLQLFANQTGLKPLTMLFCEFLVAPFWGMVVFGLWGWVISKVGLLFNGKGSFSNVRAAFAWSCIPLIINMTLFLGAIVFERVFFFQMSQGIVAPLILLFIKVCMLIMIIWSIVIFINALAEVHQFSVLKSIGTILVAGLIVCIAAFILLIALAYLWGSYSHRFLSYN